MKMVFVDMDEKGDRDQICIQSTKDGEEEEEEWSVSCSDDEKYHPSMKSKIIWEPKPEDIIELYKTLSEKKVLELEWTCPGRRSPSPPAKDPSALNESDDDLHNSLKPSDEPTEFDFDDSFNETSAITPRRTPGSAKLKGSGQKRTASLKNVMNEIMRHRKLEAVDLVNPSTSEAADSANTTSTSVIADFECKNVCNSFVDSSANKNKSNPRF